MAKYIRTKYEIGTFGGFRHDDFTGEVYTKVFNSHGTYREYTNIVAESDNIEELCDEFVIYDKDQNNGLPITCPKERLTEIKPYIQIGMQKQFNCWLKGAIWTGKGLIYVAKMNEKGELCLL